MRIVIECAWCHKVIGIKDGEQWEAALTPITHSICKACYQNITVKAGKTQAGDQVMELGTPT
jgi:hypothetical protein